MPDGSRHGETLIAVDDPDWSTEAGAPLHKVSETPYETIGAAEDELDDEDQADGDRADEDRTDEDRADEPSDQGGIRTTRTSTTSGSRPAQRRSR